MTQKCQIIEHTYLRQIYLFVFHNFNQNHESIDVFLLDNKISLLQIQTGDRSIDDIGYMQFNFVSEISRPSKKMNKSCQNH